MFDFLTFAYLDPGSGSLALQLLLGALAGIFFAVKNSWAKFKSLFKGIRRAKKDSDL